MDLKQRVVSGLGWSAGVKFLGQLITWTFTIIVMRLLAPGDYGLMGMAGIFIGFGTIFTELGLGAVIIQKQKVDETALRQTFGLLLLINFCLFLLLLLVAPLLGSLFNEPRVIPIVRLLSTQFIILPFAIIPQSLIMREMDFKKVSIVEFIAALSGSVITLYLTFKGWGVWSLVWGSMTIVTVRTTGLNLVSQFLKFPIFCFGDIKDTTRFCGYVTLSRILWSLYSQADCFIVGKLLGKEMLGFYSVALNLSSLPKDKVSGIINRVAFPAFSHIQNDLYKAATHFLKAVRVMSSFAFPILWGLSSVSPELVTIFLGDKWNLATTPLQVLSLVIPIRMISNLISPAVLGLGHPDIDFFNLLFASIVIPMGVLIGVNWGLLGVSLAWVILYPLVFLKYISRLGPILKIGILDVLGAMAKPALAAFIMYIIVIVTKLALGTNVKSVEHLVLLIIEGLIVYIGLLTSFNREGLREILGLFQK